MKYFKISVLLIFFMILSIGTINGESIDDAVQFDEDILLESQEIEELEIQEENEIMGENNEDNLGEGSVKNFTELQNDVNNLGLNEKVYLNDNYSYDESDKDINVTIREKKDRIIEGNNHTIDAKNKTGIFIIGDCQNLTIQNLIIKNAAKSAFILTNASVTTINVIFENNHDNEGGAAVWLERDSEYTSINDTFKNNHATLGSDIYVYDSIATIENSHFSNDDIEWALIYGFHRNSGTVINIINCEFSNMSSKYATVVYNTYQTNIKRSKFINLNSTSAGAIAVKGFISDDGYVPILDISDSQFINVSSLKNGGAILADMNGDSEFDDGTWYGQLKINNTLFDKCGSLFGGAITQFGGDLIVNNTNFTNNNATYLGGAIYASNTTAFILNSVFENNTAVKNTFFETGGKSNSFADRYGNFSSGAIYFDTGNFTIGFSNFTANTGAISFLNTHYEIKKGINFKDNGIAIKSYFDYEDSTIDDTVNLNNDKLNFTEVYDLNIDETGADIVYNPIIITNVSATDNYFNLKDWELVSPVEDQGKMGDCWAFGTAGALESAFLKATNMTLKLNISENNLKGTMLAYALLGAKKMTEGASIPEAVAYLLSWLGIVNDTQDSYDELGKVSPIFLNKDTYHIQNVLMIPERNASNRDQIDKMLKEALVKYGAITVYIQGANPYGQNGYNITNYAQFIGDPNAQGNHFVTLVGWNDTFSKDNFSPYTYIDPETSKEIEINATRNGAWIIKNSWGTEFGDKGYYYVSYDDTTFASTYSIAYIINETPRYNTIYQYDYDFTGYDPIEDNYTVYFLPEEDQMITAIGTYFNDTGVDYTIVIMVGDDVFAYKQSGKSLYPGFQTIALNKHIAVKKGVQFAVSIKTALFPYAENSKIVYQRGRALVDNKVLVGLMACLKAYGESIPYSAKLNYISSDKITIYGPAGDSVVAEFNGANYTITFDSEGKALLNSALKLGDYLVNLYYNDTSVSLPVHIFKSAEIVSSVDCAYNTHLVIDSYFYNLKDLALKNTVVTVKLDGQSFKLDTNANGYIGITVDGLGVGTHTLTVINPVTGESASCKIKVVSRFSGNKNIVMDYFDGTKYKIRAYGNNAKPVGAGQIVVFKLNKKTYKVKTNKDGWAILSMPKTLVPKKYTITATYKGQTVKNTITVKQILKSSNRSLKKKAKKWVLKATLKSSKKKALKGKVIKFKFNGKTYKAKTNKKGIAQVTIKKSVIKKLKKGKTYKVYITYLKDTIKKKIKVKA